MPRQTWRNTTSRSCGPYDRSATDRQYLDTSPPIQTCCSSYQCLVDVKTRNILWKGAFDLRYQKLLTVQDQVAEQIIHGLELNLSSSEAAQLKLDEPADPLAYEYYLRGVDLYARSDFPLAIRMLEKPPNSILTTP